MGTWINIGALIMFSSMCSILVNRAEMRNVRIRLATYRLTPKYRHTKTSNFSENTPPPKKSITSKHLLVEMQLQIDKL